MSKKSGVRERRKMIRIGEQLGYLTDADKEYIGDLSHSDVEATNRMTAARRRCIQEEG